MTMISASELQQVLTVLKASGASAFRYKEGEEEMEVAFTPAIDKETEVAISEDKEKQDYTRTNVMGFKIETFDNDDE